MQLSVTRRGGWRAWAPVSGTFERNLAAQASTAIIDPRLDSERRRGPDYVRVTVAMTIRAADIAEALDIAWQAFRDAAGINIRGWELSSASAAIKPWTDELQDCTV